MEKLKITIQQFKAVSKVYISLRTNVSQNVEDTKVIRV